MVSTRGKKKVGSLNKTKNEAAENASTEKQATKSQIVKVEGKFLGAEFEEKEVTIGKDGNEENDAHAEETETLTKVDHDDGNTIATVTYGEAESEQNTSENDEIDDQDDKIWEDDGGNSEFKVENLVGKEKVREDEAIQEGDNDWVGTSEEEAMEGEDSEEIEYSEEELMDDVNEEHAQTDELAIVLGKGTEEHDVHKVKISSKKMEESSERSGKLKKFVGSSDRSGRLKKVEESSEGSKTKVQAQLQKKVESKDKPESSSKRKAKKRVESMGMIFMCSSKTKNDCYQYKVLGLPESKKDIVENIYAGMRLFLYDVDLKLLYGIYKAAGPGGFNIEPKAFKSQFPSQVRFTIMDDCLPLAEEQFKKVIRDNYFTHSKFDCKLNSEQVKKLCRMFIATSKGKRSNVFGRLGNSEKRSPVHRERSRKQRVGDKRRLEPKEDTRYHESSRKRPRKVISSVLPPHKAPPAPLASSLPSRAHGRTTDVNADRRDSYSESRAWGQSRYRVRRGPIISRRDPYRDLRDAPAEHNQYRDGRELNLVSRYPGRDKRDPYVSRHDPYRDDTIDAYPERHDPYRLPHRRERGSYIEQRDPVRVDRDPYVAGIRDSYKDGRVSYVDRHVSYIDRTYSLPYSSDKNDLLSDRDGVYRGVDYRDSYRQGELFEHEAIRRRHGIASRDSNVARERPSYAEPIYALEYPSRTGLSREYHI